MIGKHPFPGRGLFDDNWNLIEDGPEDQAQDHDHDDETQRIADVQSSYQDFKAKLIEIIREQAWRKRGFPSIKAFWKAELPMIDYSTLIRLKNALEVHARLEPKVEFGVVPEYIYREVLKADEDDQPQVWADAKQLAGSLKKLRPHHIKQAMAQLEDSESQRDRLVSKAGMTHDDAVDYLVDSTYQVFGSSRDINAKMLRGLFGLVVEKVCHPSHGGNASEA